LIHDGVIVIFH